jgi:cobalt-zinc-cadmium efflux system membrane fusion protein
MEADGTDDRKELQVTRGFELFVSEGRRTRALRSIVGGAAVCLMLAGCHKQDETGREAKEAPPSAPAVVASGSTNLVTVDKEKAGQFPLTTAVSRQTFSTLSATGSVNPDVSRELPVLSLANGRVVSLNVRLGDTVKKGQSIMEVQSPDVSTAFGNYLKAVNDEHLTKITLDRDKLLYDKGAIPQTQLETAQNGEDDSVALLTASEQQLRILGVDKNKPGDTVTIHAPTSGVVIAQNATAAGAAGVTYAGAAGSLTIADLSHVWIICDVYENDLATIKLGEEAEIRLSAYPGKVLKGNVSDIGAVLDPTIRTAKVRLQVPNPQGILKLGMFATATFEGSKAMNIVALPGDAILHLHDRAFVFVPGDAAGTFRTVEIKTGKTLSGNLVEVASGLNAGQQVVANALELQNTAAQ